MQKKYVTQLSVNLIKEVFTHWPSKCLLLAVYALASALTDMVTARYNTAKCINSECLWAHDRNFWRFWPIFVWRHYALLRLSSGMLSLFVFVFINMKSFWHGLKFHIYTGSSWTILTNPSTHWISMLFNFILLFSSLKHMMTARYELSASNYVCIHVGVMHTCGIKG